MSINFEVKGQLAKLLATEDLIVEHRNVETAMFNVQTRVLTLPMWKKASECVFDMLVAHEVGHALFTPDEWDFDVPRQFVNVTEDVRVEKLMKRKYAGLSKTFYRGYEELADEDFFCLENENVSKMNLADRVNLYFKIGNFEDIPFFEGENEIVDMIKDAETFADAVLAAEVLYKFCKGKEEDNNNAEVQSVGNSQQGGGTNEGSMTHEDMLEEAEKRESDNENNSQEDEQTSEDAESHKLPGSSSNGEPNVKTANSLEDSIKDLIDFSGTENVYLEFPELNLKSVIISDKKVHDYIEDFWKPFSNEDFGWADSCYDKFKKSAQKEVNYLVKEFECKKAADSYARATTSRTGVLDCSKLHTYKYNEDLFKKVTTLANGKNHGLIFVLDWSGSMSKVMEDTVKQLYNLIWFCNKVNIPFDVYSFTNDWNVLEYDENDRPVYPSKHYVEKENLFAIGENFSMVNILTSKVSNKELERQMKNIYRVVFSFNYYQKCPTPHRMYLSGTPLNEALVSLRQIIPQFKSEHKLQKVQCIILTDGEAGPMPYHSTIKNPWDPKPQLRYRRITSNAIIRDRKIGSTYKVDSQHNCAFISFTKCIINNLKDLFPNTNFLGIRILESGDSGSFIRLHSKTWEETEALKVKWKKERCVVVKNSGYHTYIGLSGSDLSNRSEFEVDEGATKAKIKSAFVKSLRTKKTNKKVLNEFVSMIA